MILKDRIGEEEVVSISSRYDPIPMPYMLHIREKFNDDGTVEGVHRKRVYSHILGGSFIVDESEVESCPK